MVEFGARGDVLLLQSQSTHNLFRHRGCSVTRGCTLEVAFRLNRLVRLIGS